MSLTWFISGLQSAMNNECVETQGFTYKSGDFKIGFYVCSLCQEFQLCQLSKSEIKSWAWTLQSTILYHTSFSNLSRQGQIVTHSVNFAAKRFRLFHSCIMHTYSSNSLSSCGRVCSVQIINNDEVLVPFVGHTIIVD